MDAPTRVTAIIPARAGSKGIPGKNWRPLAGKPLVEYTFAVAAAATTVNRLIVSTDSEEVAALARSCGIEVPFMRPPLLAADDTPMLEVVRHAIASARETAEAYVLLQPTAPFRSAADIDAAVRLLLDLKADSVVSVREVPGELRAAWQLRIEAGRLVRLDGSPLTRLPTRRQDLAPTYIRNGAIYAFTDESLRRIGSIYGEKCIPYVMPAVRSINLDSERDWQEAERALARG